ncbi:MAG TPA: Crp/Fnr family transcriptional regulator [Vicinamibacterales bacterium]
MPALPPIARSRVFDGLTDEERQAWLEASIAREWKRGQTVARQGEPAHAFYIVETGLLKLIQLTPDGREVIVRFVGPGEPFGGIVALDKAAYPITALAVEPSRLRAWARETLAPLLQRYPQVRVNIMREMATHMTEALTRVRELTTARVGQRLAHTLLRLMRQCGRPAPGGVLLSHSLTRQELADLTGTTLYTVSRTLSKWEDAGILQTDHRRLLIRDPARLKVLSEADEE